jgi:hypothetical protein
LWWRTIFIQTDLSEVTLYFVEALIRQRRHFYIQVTEDLLEHPWVFIRHVVVQFIHPDDLSMLVIMSHHRITAHYSQISISILKICFSVCTHVIDWCLCTCIFPTLSVMLIQPYLFCQCYRHTVSSVWCRADHEGRPSLGHFEKHIITNLSGVN